MGVGDEQGVGRGSLQPCPGSGVAAGLVAGARGHGERL